MFVQVLDLQAQISGLHGKGGVTLSDVCAHSPRDPASKACVVMSMLQYYQNSAANLNKEAMDEFGFFVEADYLDHFLSCA